MKTIVAYAFIASPVLIGGAGIDMAWAASPAYCALYAREYAASRIVAPAAADAASALQRLADQAYYRCLNLDDEPEFPTTSAYFGHGIEEITGATDAVGGPFLTVEEGDASAGDETLITPPVVVAPTVVAKPKPKPKQLARGSGSRLVAWTPDWVAWCKEHYRSFNPKTGFVLTLSGEKKLCP